MVTSSKNIYNTKTSWNLKFRSSVYSSLNLGAFMGIMESRKLDWLMIDLITWNSNSVFKFEGTQNIFRKDFAISNFLDVFISTFWSYDLELENPTWLKISLNQNFNYILSIVFEKTSM